MHLNLFRVDVLAGAEDDDFLLAAGDVEVAAAVQVAEVAGVQPAVAEYGGVDVGAVEVPATEAIQASSCSLGGVASVAGSSTAASRPALTRRLISKRLSLRVVVRGKSADHTS